MREGIPFAIPRVEIATGIVCMYVRISIQTRFTIPATPINGGALYLTCACMANGQWPGDAYEQEGRRVGWMKCGDNRLFIRRTRLLVNSVWVQFAFTRFGYVAVRDLVPNDSEVRERKCTYTTYHSTEHGVGARFSCLNTTYIIVGLEC